MTPKSIASAKKNGATVQEIARVSGRPETDVRRIVGMKKKDSIVNFDDTRTKLATVREINTNTGDEATEINALHKEVCGAMLTTLQKAVRIGELLIAQKAKLPHGGWKPWTKANLSFDYKQAARYMQCYTNRGKLNVASERHLTIEQLAKGDKTKALRPKPQPKPLTFTHVLGDKPSTVEDPLSSWFVASCAGSPDIIVCRKCLGYSRGHVSMGVGLGVSCKCEGSERICKDSSFERKKRS